MITLLSKFFIEDPQDFTSERNRSAYTNIVCLLGIFLNMLLFTIKLFAGIISSSLAIIADSVNNLSDAASTVITILGFKMASKHPDPDHPFGHGRIEYISGLIISFIIILMGFELGKSSVGKIFNPEEIEFKVISVIIMGISIFIKFYMSVYNRSIGNKINSSAMKACAIDSLSDCVATFAVLVSMLIFRFFGVNLDGICGLAVAVMIVVAGVRSSLETIGPLLGQPPEREFVDKVYEIVMSNEDVIGIHDLIVHNYGPGRTMISLHAEVSCDNDIVRIHDTIDYIEKDLQNKMQCSATIHMDPICVDDETNSVMKDKVLELMQKIDCNVTIHDFKMVNGPTHTNLIFDIVIPAGCNLSDKDVKEKVQQILTEYDSTYFSVVTVDRSYI